MVGRPTTPGEKPIHYAYRNMEAFISRIQRAVITDVNEANGTCTIAWDNTPGERSNVALPFYVHFGKKTQRRKTAWQRFMPQAGDYALVGFDSNAEARIVGFDSVGYSQLAAIQEEEGKFGFRDLKAGEFDQKSSGGAYLRGDAIGTLFLAGGMSSMLLDKKNYELRVTSGRTKESFGTSVYRRGIVKRSPLPFQPELPAKATLGVLPLEQLGAAAAVMGDLYEHTVDLRAAASPSSPLAMKLLLFSLGNVMDPMFSLPAAGDTYGAVGPAGIMKFKINPSANARVLMRVYDSVPILDTPVGTEGPLGGTPTRPFEWGVDQLGNSFVNVGSTAVMGYNVWSPVFASITSQIVALPGMVYLGGTPTGPAPVLNVPVAQPNPAICGAFFGAALATFLGAVGAAASAAASAGGTPGAMTTFSTAVASACSAFAGAYGATLSKSVFIADTPAVVAGIPASFHPL